jgi:outer membrane receptor protein involved in Fe transport
MYKHILIFILLFQITCIAQSQKNAVVGQVVNAAGEGLSQVQIGKVGSPSIIYSDSNGRFSFQTLDKGIISLAFRHLGYLTQIKNVHIEDHKLCYVTLTAEQLDLSTIVIKSDQNKQNATIGKLDMQLRTVSSSQDLLRLVPGLFIAQHAGGGKAEQIFMRGFDIDHGTDFAIYADGIPVNMPSHAHGQGYADLHFLIPETVRELEVNKGPYTTRYGDLATSGSGEFKTLNSLDKSIVKLEYGNFNTKRALLMLNVANKTLLSSKMHENLYIASEYKYTDAYFASKQNFNRFNVFAKYTGITQKGSMLQISLSNFQSHWNASGQIPERKVMDGSITPFGSIDSTEGGQTSRSNFNIIYNKPIRNGFVKQQLYYSRYNFNLYSNFTFFLIDSIHGDQINQADHRNLFGYNGTIQKNGKLWSKNIQTTLGAGLRYDIADIQLNHTQQRTFLNSIVSGKLNQANGYIYADENIGLTAKLKMNIGLRIDAYQFKFNNTLNGDQSGNVFKALASPKLNFFYTHNNRIQYFARSGYGFHSNDARAVVVGGLQNTLPRALGYEVGTTLKPKPRLLINIALWALHLQSELVYVGDAGIVEPAGKSKRVGIDIGARYQAAKYIFIDADFNMNTAKLVEEPIHANYIPLAPTFTSTGGITYKRQTGLNGSIRYRYMADRPAIEDYSLIAKGYLLVDAIANYTYKNFVGSITMENIFSSAWKEAQFATESRLKNEQNPITEIHFTPGTPRAIRVSIAYKF